MQLKYAALTVYGAKAQRANEAKTQIVCGAQTAYAAKVWSTDSLWSQSTESS